jgi:beta-glucan synthesis-associated protein KRE6
MEYSARNISDLNPFFYGTTLVHTPKIFSYQADALSANTQLNDTHYQSHHLYRLEWEPPAPNGTGGYLKWFTDNEYVFGLYGRTLDFMKTEIPSEPMYFIINTAVSSHWGFPQPCPEGCECSCFECGNPDCACGLPAGYCENFPAHFEIDYVRVYQAKNESRHFLGCSPPHRPTDLWIKGHPQKFTTEGQRKPLEDVQCGGAPCTSHADCGGQKKGVCNSKQICHCKEGWTGPHCLAHQGTYDFNATTPSKSFDSKFASSVATSAFPCTLPIVLPLRTTTVTSMMLPKSLIVILVTLIAGFGLSMSGSIRTKSTRTKYQPIGGMAAIPHAAPGSAARGNYQNPPNDGYAITAQQKDVTYCVIDGRLVDQQESRQN